MRPSSICYVRSYPYCSVSFGANTCAAYDVIKRAIMASSKATSREKKMTRYRIFVFAHTMRTPSFMLSHVERSSSASWSPPPTWFGSELCKLDRAPGAQDKGNTRAQKDSLHMKSERKDQTEIKKERGKGKLSRIGWDKHSLNVPATFSMNVRII